MLPSTPRLLPPVRLAFFTAALVATALLPACKRGTLKPKEYMYVSAAETSLRDRVATMYNKVGSVHNGERVEILEKQKRFLKVRTDAGQEGWIEMRSLVPQDVFDGFQKLAQDNLKATVQAHGTTRAELNMHLTPSREGEHLYQLKDGEKLEVLKRTTAEKNAGGPKPPQSAAPVTKNTGAPPATQGQSPAGRASQSATSAQAAPAAKPVPAPIGAKAAKSAEPAKPIMEDWYLVRDPAGHVGWVLLRMIDLDIPLEVAQYAEGQRIMGYFVLNTVQDEDKQVPQYLVCLNEPKDGLPWDFNQIRVFTWNRARHRYETAYRERNLEGFFPVTVGHRYFEKEGDLPTFTVRKQFDNGQMLEETYKLNGPIVRRVLTPEEEAAEKAKRQAALEAKMKARAAARQSGSTKPAHHKHH